MVFLLNIDYLDSSTKSLPELRPVEAIDIKFSSIWYIKLVKLWSYSVEKICKLSVNGEILFMIRIG